MFLVFENYSVVKIPVAAKLMIKIQNGSIFLFEVSRKKLRRKKCFLSLQELKLQFVVYKTPERTPKILWKNFQTPKKPDYPATLFSLIQPRDSNFTEFLFSRLEQTHLGLQERRLGITP